MDAGNTQSCLTRKTPLQADAAKRTPTDAAAQKWAEDFYAQATFPDRRLKARLLKTSAAFAARPADSIPQACSSWSQTKGAYRFIENERVTVKSLQQPAADNAARECAGREVVLAVQDTTALSFSSARQAPGLGPVNDEPNARGMFLHPVLALRENGLPIGLLHQQTWSRNLKARDKGADRSSTPIEEKESFKWLRGMRGARQALDANLPADRQPRLIHVFDREGDIFAVFEELINTGDGAVIRSHHNRRIIRLDGRGALSADAVRATPQLGSAVIEVPRKQNQPARQARIEIRACRVTLTPSASRGSTGRWLEMTLLEVWEPEPPPGVAALHWLLWTTDVVADFAGAMRTVAIYKTRWKIEEFNLILKSGCRIEQLQLGSAERLAKVVALYAPVALRILQLRDLSRLTPEAPCSQVLSPNQWRALWTYIHQEQAPSGLSPPSVQEAAKWIGRLGGHLGRKRDGMPGVRALWRGWRDLDLLTVMYSLSLPSDCS